MKSKILEMIVLIAFIIMLFQGKTFANEEDNEMLEMQEVWEEITETTAEVVKEPTLNSRAAVVLDRTSKTVIFEKNSKESRPMASTTKIMTAILVLERGNLSEIVEVSRKGSWNWRL